MSSGCYFPPPVLFCEIPKSDGKTRTLGIPTVSDRVAQMVVKMILEPKVDPDFLENSYGYRPGKSALDAVGKARERCWKFDWVIDLDIQGYFDSIDHDLMMHAVKKYTDEKWILLYVRRWLEAKGKTKDGKGIARNKGIPQGGVISPLLANIFLHHVFDKWMKEQFPTLPFERYADDIIVHCETEKQAVYVLAEIKYRLGKCKLTMHPEKTKIVYCKDCMRKKEYAHTQFDFLGYAFCSRKTKSKNGNMFMGFTSAVSDKAVKKMRYIIRSWKLVKLTPLTVKELADKINPVVRGWLQYYGAYRRSTLNSVLRQLEFSIAKWVMRKFKKLHRKFVAATRWLTSLSKREPKLFAHWHWRFKTAE